MTAGWSPPAHWTETASQLRVSGNCILDSSGNGAITFSPDNANQRWVVTSVLNATNQPQVSLVIPYCTLALNTINISQLSQGNQRGSTYNGQQNSFSGSMDIGPCDFVSALFYPPPGSTAAQIAVLVGVEANVVVIGTKYTRRG